MLLQQAKGEKKKKAPACKDGPHLYLRCMSDVFIFAENLTAILSQEREHFFFPPKENYIFHNPSRSDLSH